MMSDLYYSSLTYEDLSNINVALQLSIPHAADPETIKKLQMKVLYLARVATKSNDQETK